MPRRTASSGTSVLPSLNQRPIQRRKQKQAGAAGAPEMFFDFGEIVEVILSHQPT